MALCLSGTSPNCLGASDGKHIAIKAPKHSGSMFFNYKGFLSIVFPELVDADYKFTFVDVESNGRISDGGVLRESCLQAALNNNSLGIPPATSLPERNTPVPYVIVADEAFPLKENLMKPFPAKSLDDASRVFNYRLSRARRVSENAFGILVLHALHYTIIFVQRVLSIAIPIRGFRDLQHIVECCMFAM